MLFNWGQSALNHIRQWAFALFAQWVWSVGTCVPKIRVPKTRSHTCSAIYHCLICVYVSPYGYSIVFVSRSSHSQTIPFNLRLAMCTCTYNPPFVIGIIFFPLNYSTIYVATSNNIYSGQRCTSGIHVRVRGHNDKHRWRYVTVF